VSDGSFWSRYRDVDAAERAGDMLGILDAYAALEPMRRLKDAATAALELSPGDHVLDVGCGTGVDLAPMLAGVRPGGTVTGVDVSELAVAEVNRRFADEPGIEAVAGDVQALPFPDAAFQACRADRTLQHVERPDAALAELRRVLAPGGRLVVLEILTELSASGDAGAHPAVAQAREQWATEQERRDWLPLMLPLLLSRGGFSGIATEVAAATTTDPETIDGLLAIRERAGGAAGLRELAAAGGLSLTLRGLRFSARA
jgi:ubiquinone/menaquinone biosynthesis C-methylase UbiE